MRLGSTVQTSKLTFSGRRCQRGSSSRGLRCRDELFDHQLRNRSTIDTKQLAAILVKNGDLETFTVGAGGRRLARLWFSRSQQGLSVKSPASLGVQLKGTATGTTHMVEAAFGLARIDDVGALAMRTTNEILNKNERHNFHNLSRAQRPKLPCCTCFSASDRR
jgi:hypothetical protein